MQITPATSPNFQAKFFYSDSLKQIAEYAVEHEKFDKLNQARKNIDKSYLRTRLKVDISKTETGLPQVTFTTYTPQKKCSYRRK